MQQPATIEAAALQRMSDEHITASIAATKELQLRNLELQEKQLDRVDAEKQREHERAMKQLDLRAHTDQWSRLYLFGGGLVVGLLVLFLTYRGQYETAEKLVIAGLSAAGGFVAGKRSRREQPDEE